jgi:hypothetical protein
MPEPTRLPEVARVSSLDASTKEFALRLVSAETMKMLDASPVPMGL